MAYLPRQPSHGGCPAESASPLLSHRSYQRPIAARPPKAEAKAVEANHRSREEFVRKVLDAYRQTPGTTGNIRHQDRLLAAALHDLAIPLKTVENALVLAAARRLLRPADAPPLATVRSLA